ncbi:uncharacterized protein I206_107296 [Kwoniella pini CBS 10737]|uniref:Pirin n=1 Tax=Kwoniella pini CBS 10737 TaxID=1296096 RepID=A0A1B9HYM1_9TREE|nr:pirin [Kwoniella pini CBS 10737]OCF48383.1 pirin [Kwoniella pini CBS 10737]
MQFKFRANEDRGGADHGWLKTFHTFSFANYYDPFYEKFGCLRVINEDRVLPLNGFPKHSHKEFEIFSYIISGELTHKDSLGNIEKLKKGNIQMTSGGTGISHSEFNENLKEQVHFLQIWSLPFKNELKPKYFTRNFENFEKENKLLHIVAPIGYEGVEEIRECKGLTPIHSPLHFFASLLSPNKSVIHKLLSSINGKLTKKIYIHLVQTSGYNTKSASKDGKGPLIQISGGSELTKLGEGDGVFITSGKVGEEIKIENIGNGVGEVVLFEMDDE